LSQTTLYASVLAKLGVERSKLLGETKIKTLTESKNPGEFTTQLRENSYQTQISNVPTPLTSRKLERAFNENLIESYVKIIKNSPEKAAAFLLLYLVRFEVENIKVLIKAANAKLSLEEKLGKVYLSAEAYLKHRAVFEDAAKAVDVVGTVNALKNTEYASALVAGLRSYEENASTTCLDVLLDKHFYEKLYDVYQSLPKKEKLHAHYYVSMETDGFVLLTLLRGKNLNYDPNWLRLAVPNTKFNVSEETVEAIVTAPDFDSALKVPLQTAYAQFFVRAQTAEETLANAEKAFTKAVFMHAKENRFVEIFNVGSVLAFMRQKQVEVHNLVIVSLGVEAALKPEEIQGQLLL
jgi:V/A-type H+-transporting ATPase subunit C